MNFNFQRLGKARTLEVLTTRFSVQPVPNSEGDSQVPVFWLEHEIGETGPDVYAWSPTEELTIDDDPAMSQVNSPYLVATPTNLALGTSTSTGNNPGLGSNSTNYALSVTWTDPADGQALSIQINAKLHSDTAWFDAGTAALGVGLAYVYGINHGQSYDVRIRTVRSNGGYSSWVEIDSFQA